MTSSLEKRSNPSSVDGDGLAGDVARALRREKCGERSELTRLAEASHRDLGFPFCESLLTRNPLPASRGLRKLFDPLSPSIPRKDVIDRDAKARHLVCESAGKTRDCRAQAVRLHQSIDRLLYGNGRYVDDATPPALLHTGHHCAAEIHYAHECEIDSVLPHRRRQ